MMRQTAVRRMLAPLAFGVAGVAVLLGLGTWQVQRLQWKEALLASIEAKSTAAAVEIPAEPDPDSDNFLAVHARGATRGEPLRVLSSQRGLGPGFRIISRFDMNGRAILLDRGFVAEDMFESVTPEAWLSVEGNLHWPREHDRFFTPEPEDDLWFAREVGRMAEVLGADPVLLVARKSDGEDGHIHPWPVSTGGIPNNHLQYAITWFALALGWAAMTVYWLSRIRRGVS